jgi:hypothetical protein
MTTGKSWVTPTRSPAPIICFASPRFSWLVPEVLKDLGGLGPNAESQAFVTLVTKPNRPAPTGWVFRFLAMVEVWEKF